MPSPPYDTTGMAGTEGVPHVVVVEWGDGTVSVTGPFASLHAAKIDAETQAVQIGQRWQQAVSKPDADGHVWVVGEDGEDESFVYALILNTPE